MAPNQKQEDDMEDYQQYDPRSWLETYYIFVDKNEVVEGDEAEHADKMRVY